MILIADGGSTKTNWSLINEHGRKILFNTEGYNPYFSKEEYIVDSLNSSLPDHLEKDKISEVYYYGAGCSTEENVNIVKRAMQRVYPNSKVFVGHDLLAACRALLGDDPGFVAILGTGTNTCIYGGQDITLNIDSLGYFLGDEGSGCFIGKRILSDYMKGFMPKELHKIFSETYGLTNEDILDHIYNNPLPNRFCAGFSKFIYDNNKEYEDYTYATVDYAFTAFFDNLVTHYPDYKTYKLNCIGSVGYSFRDILSVVSNRYEMGIGKIIRSPIDELVEYHLSKRK